jgi:hypothetical protein
MCIQVTVCLQRICVDGNKYSNGDEGQTIGARDVIVGEQIHCRLVYEFYLKHYVIKYKHGGGEEA